MTNPITITIIDYQMGNLFSVSHACLYLGAKTEITSDKQKILSADAVILPGVGAFGEAMTNLKNLDMILPLKDFIASGKPFMGICLGMQLLFEESEEFGIHKGLALIKGNIKKFPSISPAGKKTKVPQIGWNSIHIPQTEKANGWKSDVFNSIIDGEYMYFIHSYYAIAQDKTVILSETEYEGIKYCSAIQKDNILATQFHPEKSGKAGLRIYENWIKIITSKKEVR